MALLLSTALACGGFATPARSQEAAEAGTRLTWPEAIQLASRNNPELESARQTVTGADALRKGAYSSYYPQIQAVLFGEKGYQENIDGLSSTTNYTEQYTAQLELQQKIFDGFEREGNVDKQKAELSLAFASLDAQKALVSYDLKSAFAQMIYAQELVEINRGVIDIRENNARMVKLLYESGTEDKGAWLLSKANEQQAVFDHERSIRNLEVSEIQLMTVLGRQLPGPVRVVGALVTPNVTPKPDFRSLAVQTPVYFQQKARVDAAAAGVTIAQSGWYPTISASAAAGRKDSSFPPEKNAWSVGVTASYDLFEGGETYFNVRAARAGLIRSMSDLRSGTDQASLSLSRTFKGYVDAVDNVRIEKDLLEATSLRYKIAQAEYRNGLESFQDFNTITDNYISQQRSYLAALRDAIIAEAQWEQARGTGAIP